MDKIKNFLSGREFRDCHAEINAQNRQAIHVLVTTGLPLSLLNLLTQVLIVGSDMSPLRRWWMVIFFGVAMAMDRLIPEDYPHSTAMLYLFETPVMLISILLGTLWDPNHQASTFLLFMMALPVFVLDRPDRSVAFLSFWMLLFLGLDALVKPEEIRMIDSLHVLEFFFASVTVTCVVLRVRLDSVRHLKRVQYHLNHDQQTGCLSRYALDQRAETYLNQPLFLLFADLDQLKLYNDFYGHDVGHAMTLHFCRCITDVFGAAHTYRYGGDEILCVIPGGAEADCMAGIDRFREALAAFRHEDRQIALTCAVGYVTGAAGTIRELHEMIQLADIYAHRVKMHGQNQTLGSPFDQQHLREGIIESNVYTHARAYETNALTGLPGMSYFVMRGDEMLASVIDIARRPVVGHFKLLHLRDFNSEFGYAQGDELIAFTAKQLRAQLGNRHICYITSSHFGIMCYRDEAEAAIRNVNAALAGFRPGFPMRGLAGFSEYTGGERTISLLDQAKIAQKSIRESDGESVRFYDARLDEEVRFHQYILAHLDEAIESGHLKVYYQPIARAITGEVCNEEALSRWDDARYGFLMPGRFIPPLEEAGLMYKVNLNVVRQVLRDFETRRAKGVPIVPVSVNLSRKDFERCDMVRAITDMIDASGFPRSLIKIEITESAFTSNQELLRREVNRLRESGLEVWLDDFGSEYSTLNLLQELDFDLIKIDMQFMKNFSAEGKNFVIVSNIIDMAKRLGITTLIEGIETPEQYRAMRQLGCEKIQGFLFNRPNPMDYIVNRALTGTGLVFEKPEASPYYDAISRIDLRSPMQGGGLRMNRETPSGVLEARDGDFRVLTGNEGFMRLLAAWGVLAGDAGEGRFKALAAPPPPLIDAASTCAGSDDWTHFDVATEAEGALSVYVRRVSRYEREGRLALLTIILHR